MKKVAVESSSAQEGDGFVFGNADEILKQRKQGLAKRVKQRNHVEPEALALADEYLDKEDDRTIDTDLPERMQV